MARSLSPEARTRVVAHIQAGFPDLTDAGAAALLTAAKAARGKPLLLLDAYFTAHPDALTAPPASAPPPLVRLAHALHAAGQTGVALPSCAGCGRQPSRLPGSDEHGRRLCLTCAQRRQRKACARCGKVRKIQARRPDGGVCLSCHDRDPDLAQPCSQCGRHRTPASHTLRGEPLCRTCLPRPTHTCARCGQQAPAQAISKVGPVCKRCYRRPPRRCGRCGRVRPIVVRATDEHPDLCGGCYQGPVRTCSTCGRERACAQSVAGAPVCPSCAPRPRRRCASCGATRPVHADWPLGPVCRACYTHIRNHPAPCPRCTRTRPLIAADPGGRRYCGPCAGVDLDYSCRICGHAGRGSLRYGIGVDCWWTRSVRWHPARPG
jgi:hypothetical protein